jgi:hypothetical protein
MVWIRKALGVLFAALGAYYCALGGFVLLRLPSVTSRWIQQSGDPDFHYDYGLFMTLTALGAIFVALLGWWTVVQGVATARGRRASWLGLAISALPLHWFWFLHRTIGAGLLDRPGQIAVQQSAAIQFGSVCLGYLLLWLLTRRPDPDPSAHISLQSTAPVDG